MLLYRILSYFLFVMGVFMGFGILLTAPVAFANPKLLIDVFIPLTVVLYTFSSFLFLIKGISKRQVFKYSFRDFVIVNALASIVYIGRSLWKIVVTFSDQTEIIKMAKDLAGLQQSGSILSEAVIQSTLKAGLFFSLFYVIVLAGHIVFTIALVKKHRNLFMKSEGNIL
ncbi:MAG TPA: hypothetical protein VK173_06925 [Lacibacter sp.]|nr:hypothetical protein [Lacibacter sp.]